MKYLIILLSFLIVACGEPVAKKKDPLPKDILTEEQLAKVLADIYLVDAAVGVKRLQPIQQRVNVPKFYSDVYLKHGIDKAKFEKTLKYYARHPQDLDEAYTMTIDVLSQLQAEESRKK